MNAIWSLVLDVIMPSDPVERRAALAEFDAPLEGTVEREQWDRRRTASEVAAALGLSVGEVAG